MKTKEQLAKELAQKFFENSRQNNNTVKIAFEEGIKVGIEFTQQWIDVKDMLPPINQIILYKRKIRNEAHEKGDNWIVSTGFASIVGICKMLVFTFFQTKTII